MNMKLALGSLLFAAAFAYTSATVAFPALTLTAGTVAYTLTGTQVALAASAIAGLAIAKSALALAANADRARGKRDVTGLDYSLMFDGIDQQDHADCGKLLVCHSFAVEDAHRTSEEDAIVKLFEDDMFVIQQNAYGKYQWAAYTGTFKNPGVCQERYKACPVEVETLSNLINLQ